MLEVVNICNYIQNKFMNFKFRLHESNSYFVYSNQFGMREKNMQYHKHPSYTHLTIYVKTIYNCMCLRVYK